MRWRGLAASGSDGASCAGGIIAKVSCVIAGQLARLRIVADALLIYDSGYRVISKTPTDPAEQTMAASMHIGLAFYLSLYAGLRGRR
jgi:hypothetical protein